jgi:transcriptional regulator with XRE-family HTH domain
MTNQPSFSSILRGLMETRGLSPRAVSRASARAESTILQLLHERIKPTPEIVKDIAPALQISEADLLTIAGFPAAPISNHPEPYRNTAEIGELVSIAASLTTVQVRKLLELARNIENDDRS